MQRRHHGCVNTGNLAASYPANTNAVELRPDAANYARPLWFPHEPTQSVEIEQGALWALQDRLRYADARCQQLEWKNRELMIRFAGMRDELLLMATERQMTLDPTSRSS
jgi:hypothetical protein